MAPRDDVARLARAGPRRPSRRISPRPIGTAVEDLHMDHGTIELLARASHRRSKERELQQKLLGALLWLGLVGVLVAASQA